MGKEESGEKLHKGSGSDRKATLKKGSALRKDVRMKSDNIGFI